MGDESKSGLPPVIAETRAVRLQADKGKLSFTVEYPQGCSRLADIATFALEKTIKIMGLDKDKMEGRPLRVIIHEDTFTYNGLPGNVEVYGRDLLGNPLIILGFDNGYRQEYREQAERYYGIGRNISPYSLFCYLAAHAAGHLIQDARCGFRSTGNGQVREVTPDFRIFADFWREQHTQEHKEEEANRFALKVMKLYAELE